MWLITTADKTRTYYRERLRRKSRRALVQAGYHVTKADLRALLPYKRLSDYRVTNARKTFSMARYMNIVSGIRHA
jgi:hypothetical protein